MMKYVLLSGHTVAVEVLLKKMKHLRLRVCPDGRVTLSAPVGTPTRAIDRFLDSQRDWLNEHLASLPSDHANDPPQHISQGAKIRYLGGFITAHAAFSEKPKASLAGDILTLSLPDPDDTAALDALFTKWWKNTALEYYKAVLDALYPVVSAHGAPYPSLAVHKTVSRWGSCNRARAKINLSYYLLRADAACIEYVVLHELTHLLYSGHGKDFHAFVAAAMPDHLSRRAKLALETPGGL